MNEEQQNYLTEEKFHRGLAQFTEETLLPAIERIIDDKLDKFEFKMDEKFDSIKQQIYAISIEIEEIKVKLDRLDKRTAEDNNANHDDIEKLRKRVEELEKKVQVLQSEKIKTV